MSLTTLLQTLFPPVGPAGGVPIGTYNISLVSTFAPPATTQTILLTTLLNPALVPTSTLTFTLTGSAPPANPPSGSSIQSGSPTSKAPNPPSAFSSALVTKSNSTSHSSSSRIPGTISSSPTNSGSKSNDTLLNGTVAGVVVAAAVGLALITFLLTYFFTRRSSSRGKDRRGDSGDYHVNGSGGFGQKSSQTSRPEPKTPLATETANSTSSWESCLPQSEDDRTLQSRVKTIFDQLEVHVENIYKNESQINSGNTDAALVSFDSPNLPKPLIKLLNETANTTLLIKHALIYCLVSSISLHGTTPGLLPDEFILLLNTVDVQKNVASANIGLDQCMSKWRVLTAYIRAFAAEEYAYISQRDRRVNEIIQHASRAFGRWRKSKYKNDEQVQSLSAIFKSGADLGILLFSQPSEVQFQWPDPKELGSSRVVMTPALVKKTDEKGRKLDKPHVLLHAVIEKLR